MQFDNMIKDLAVHIRNELSQIEEISKIQFSIEIYGRTHDGELRVRYEIGSSYQDGGVVKGPKLDVVLKEYLRRFGWDKRNQPLEITFSPAKAAEDEINDINASF